MRTLNPILAGLALVLTLGTACGKSDSDKRHLTRSLTEAPATQATVSPIPNAAAPAEAAKEVPKVDLELETVGNTMTFNKTALTVPAGAEVHMTFKNNATATTLPHNFVLVKPGTEAAVAA